MTRVLSIVLICGVGLLSAQTFERSFAVVVGVGTYRNAKRLPNATSDAKAIAALLRSQHYQIKELYDQEATKSNIIDAMEKVVEVVSDRDRVLFFFAGHGHTESRGGRDWGYIVPYDGKRQTISSMIGMDELVTESERMGLARHQLFLMDSCYGGILGNRDDPLGVDSRVPNYLDEITRRKAREMLTAGGKNQEVEDGPANGHSLFTTALLSAIQDGKADINSDGYITFPELSAYIATNASSRQQTPAWGRLPGDELGDFWFVSPVQAKQITQRAEKQGILRDSIQTLNETRTASSSLNVSLPDAGIGVGTTNEEATVNVRSAALQMAYSVRLVWGNRLVDVIVRPAAKSPADHLSIQRKSTGLEELEKLEDISGVEVRQRSLSLYSKGDGTLIRLGIGIGGPKESKVSELALTVRQGKKSLVYRFVSDTVVCDAGMPCLEGLDGGQRVQELAAAIQSALNARKAALSVHNSQKH